MTRKGARCGVSQKAVRGDWGGDDARAGDNGGVLYAHLLSGPELLKVTGSQLLHLR